MSQERGAVLPSDSDPFDMRHIRCTLEEVRTTWAQKPNGQYSAVPTSLRGAYQVAHQPWTACGMK